MVAEWSLHRKTENTRQSNLVNGVQSVILSAQSRQELQDILDGNSKSMSVDNISPKFLKISSLSTSYPAETLMVAPDGKITQNILKDISCGT